MASYNVCTKRVLSYSFQLKRSVCLSKLHLKCLSVVSNDDSIHVERDSNSLICIVCTRKSSEVYLLTKPLSMIHMDIRNISKKRWCVFENLESWVCNNCVFRNLVKYHKSDNYSMSGYNSKHNSRLSWAEGVQLYFKDIIEYIVQEFVHCGVSSDNPFIHEQRQPNCKTIW